MLCNKIKEYILPVTITTATFISVSGASAALGAVIRGHSVRDEAVAVLTGSSITGVCAEISIIAMLLCVNETSPYRRQDFVIKITAGLFFIATLLSPAVAEPLVNNSEGAKTTLTDTLIGAACIFITLIVVLTFFKLAQPLNVDSLCFKSPCSFFRRPTASAEDNIDLERTLLENTEHGNSSNPSISNSRLKVTPEEMGRLKSLREQYPDGLTNSDIPIADNDFILNLLKSTEQMHTSKA